MKWKVSRWTDYSEVAAASGVPVGVLDMALPPTEFMSFVEADTKGQAIAEAYKLEGVTVENMIVEPAE